MKPIRPEPPKSLLPFSSEPELTMWGKTRDAKSMPVVSWTAVRSHMAGAVVMNFYTYKRSSTAVRYMIGQDPPKYQMKLDPSIKEEDWPHMAENCMLLLNLKDEV